MKNETKFRLAQVNGQGIHYTDQGAGQPLVLVHGWGFDHTCWQPMIDRLKTDYRVIAVDVRGHGQSESATSSYRISDLSDDLFGLLGHLELPEPPVLIGHSLGGAIVQQFAVDNPSAARAIVLMDSDLNTPANRLVLSIATRVSAWAMRLAAVVLGARRSLRLLPPMLNLATYSGSWRRAHRDYVKQAGRRFLDNHVDDLIWSLLAWGTRPNLSKSVGSISTPVLLIRGSKDLIVTRGKMKRLAKAIPGSRMLVVEGSGHATITEQPDEVVNMINLEKPAWEKTPNRATSVQRDADGPKLMQALG